MKEHVWIDSELAELNKFMAEVWVITRYVAMVKRRQAKKS